MLLGVVGQRIGEAEELINFCYLQGGPDLRLDSHQEKATFIFCRLT